jgi:hypothetical protein
VHGCGARRVDVTGSGPCIILDFDVDGVETLDSVAAVLVYCTL